MIFGIQLIQLGLTKHFQAHPSIAKFILLFLYALYHLISLNRAKSHQITLNPYMFGPVSSTYPSPKNTPNIAGIPQNLNQSQLIPHIPYVFFFVNKCSIFCHQRSSRNPWLLIVSRVMLSKILEIITIHELRELRNPINQPVDVGIDQSLWKFTSSSYINFCSKSIKQRLPTQLL